MNPSVDPHRAGSSPALGTRKLKGLAILRLIPFLLNYSDVVCFVLPVLRSPERRDRGGYVVSSIFSAA